jgi:hypothetical protein
MIRGLYICKRCRTLSDSKDTCIHCKNKQFKAITIPDSLDDKPSQTTLTEDIQAFVKDSKNG